MNAVASLAITSSQNRDAENDLPSASVAPELITDDNATVSALLWYSGRQLYSVSELFSRNPEAAECGQRLQPPQMRHHAGLGETRGARGEDVERGVSGLHRRRRRRVGGRGAHGESLQVLDGQRLGGARAAALGDGADQVGLRDQHLGVQQAQAVRQHLAALVVVEHAGDGAALDRGQHRQHRVGRVAQHDRDDVAAADAARGQHRGVPVGGRVGVAVGQLLVAESQKDPVTVASGPLLEHRADRLLGVRLGQQTGQRAAHYHRHVGQDTRHPRRDIGQPDRRARSPVVIGHVIPLGSPRRLCAGSQAGAHASTAAPTLSTSTNRSIAACEM